jgi:hypothetical protein
MIFQWEISAQGACVGLTEHLPDGSVRRLAPAHLIFPYLTAWSLRDDLSAALIPDWPS